MNNQVWSLTDLSPQRGGGGRVGRDRKIPVPTGCQLSSRFQERPSLKRTRWKVIGQDTRHAPLASTDQRWEHSLTQVCAHSPPPHLHNLLRLPIISTTQVCTVSSLQNFHFQLPILGGLLLPPGIYQNCWLLSINVNFPYKQTARGTETYYKKQNPSASAGCFCILLHLLLPRQPIYNS